MKNSRLRMVGRSSAIAVALAVWPAVAQTADSTKSTPVGTSSDHQNVPAAADGLADIVVTAQRREETLQRTALAVSAVSGDDLARANVSDVTSLTRLVPSLVVQPATGTSTAFYLRGVGALTGNAFTENPVAFNYNQVYIARPAAALGTFYDLQRVEVLKGPQGTLYGRNATGGAINVIPNRPILGKRSMTLSFEAANYRSVRAQAAVNLPIGDTIALRFAGQVANRDGYLSDGYDDENGQAARASLLFRPNERFSIMVTGDYFHQGGRGPGGVLVPGALTPLAPPVDERVGGSDPRSIAALRAAFPVQIDGGLIFPPRGDGFVNADFWGVTGEIEVDLGFAKLTVIPAFRRSKPNYLTFSAGYYGRVIESADQVSVEARLSSRGDGPFNYVVGVYAFDEEQKTFNDFFQGNLLRTTFNVDLSNKSYAAFGQASYALTDTLRVIAGGRYTEDKKSNDTRLTQLSFGVGPSSRVMSDLKFNKFTYKAGLEFDAGARNLLYANVATGYKSGGFFVAAIDNTFTPENITSYTAGSKNRFLDNRLQFNVEAFYWKYQDQQVNYIGPVRTSATTIGSALVTANAGRSRIYGAEAELVLQVTKADLFSANLQYLNGKYTDFVFNAYSATGAPPRTTCRVTPNTTITPTVAGARIFDVNCSGKPQINSPKWSLNLSYEHVFHIASAYELTFGARTKIESSRFLSPEYLPEERQGSYMQSDLFVTFADPTARWSLTGFVNNVEDKTIYSGSAIRPVLSVIYNQLRPPRTYGLRAAYSF